MDVEALLEDFREQLDLLNEAILSFERIATGAAPRRGRPQKGGSDVLHEVPASPRKHLHKRRSGAGPSSAQGE